MVFVVVLKRFASLREFHLDLPVVKGTLTVHLLDRLQCVLLPRESDVSEAPRVSSLVIFNNID